MIRLLLPATIGLALASGVTLSTDYTKDRALRVETTWSVEWETTASEVLVDGEPREGGRGGFGGGGTERTLKIVHVDEVLAHEDGKPTRIRRTFKDVENKGTSTRGENEQEFDRESPFGDVTLEITLDEEGDAIAEVVDGDEPEDDSLLEGHSLTLALDALLPDGDVGEGDSWEVDKDDVLAALGIALEAKLFPRPERPEGPPDGERRGGGGRGGFRGGGGGDSTGQIFQAMEEGADLELVSENTDHEGIRCAVVEFELEASGELPERERGGRRDFAFGLGAEGFALETEFEVELSGKLYFSIEEKRPVLFHVEGKLSTDMNREMSRGDREMSIKRTQEGSFELDVQITEEDDE